MAVCRSSCRCVNPLPHESRDVSHRISSDEPSGSRQADRRGVFFEIIGIHRHDRHSGPENGGYHDHSVYLSGEVPQKFLDTA